MDKNISSTKEKETNVQLATRPDRPKKLGGLISLMALCGKYINSKPIAKSYKFEVQQQYNKTETTEQRKRMHVKLIRYIVPLMTTIASCMTGCSTTLNSSLVKQGQQTATVNSGQAKPFTLPEEIDDLRKIPQDVRPFAATIRPVSSDEQARALQNFRNHYFSPWTVPLYNINKAADDMEKITTRNWYGENRIRITPDRIRDLLDVADLNRIPSLNQFAITVSPAFVRGLPTSKPYYEASDDFPFDQLQYTELKQNEPVRILHASADGAWLLIQAAFGYGWVEAAGIRLADESIRQMLIKSRQVVIVNDFSVIRDLQGKALPQPKIGTLYPLIKEEPDHWLVNVAVAGSGEYATLKTARIPKKDARPHPLPFNAENVGHIGNQLLKTPYGWGELFRDRDCSATTRDFFFPFGIWLPRNSMQQLKTGTFLPLASLANSDKEKLLRDKGVPFRTLVHRRGHIMLYAGLADNKPVVLHNTWAIRFKPENGQEEKFYIGRTVLTTLEAGKELPLSRGTLLDHIDGIITLPAFGSEGKQSFIPNRGVNLMLNYPGIKAVRDNTVFFADGTSLPYDDKKIKNLNEKLRNADIEDQFAQDYPAFTKIEAPEYLDDPGRFINKPLLKKLYGSNKSEVEKNLDLVVWLPRHDGKKLLFNKNENAAAQLQKVSNELDKLPDDIIKQLTEIEHTYYYDRTIAAAARSIPHNYGIAIDFAASNSSDQLWKRENHHQNEMLQKIVEIFEKYGFVWGGRWYHYDTMHFEYRPEMFERVQ